MGGIAFHGGGRRQKELVWCEDITRPYPCDTAEVVNLCLLSVHQRIPTVPVRVFLSSTSEVGSAVTKSTPWAFVMWNEKKERG